MIFQISEQFKNKCLSFFRYFKWLILIPFVFSVFYVLDAAITSSIFGYDLHMLIINTKYLLEGINIYDVRTIVPFDLQPRYPASCYLFLSPVAFLNWSIIKWIWFSLSLIMTYLAANEISARYCSGRKWEILFIFISSLPWRDNIYWGQNSLWSFYFFLLAVKFDDQKKLFFSGITLALSLFKYALTIPMCILYFLIFKKSWKPVMIAASFHLFFNFLFSLYLKKSLLYLLTSPLLRCAGIKHIQNGYDLSRFVYFLHGDDVISIYVNLAMAFLVILILIFKYSKDQNGVLAFVALVSSLFLYHENHDNIVFILAFVWMLNRNKFELKVLIFYIGILCACFLSPHYFEHNFANWEINNFTNWNHVNVFNESGDGLKFTFTIIGWFILMKFCAWYLVIGIFGYLIFWANPKTNTKRL